VSDGVTGAHVGIEAADPESDVVYSYSLRDHSFR
jgi:hypothetical protein